MKVKQVIKILGALNDTGKVACDMYTLHESEYYSQSQGTMAISEMEFTHVLRAFRKICDEDVRIDTQEGKIKDMVSKEAYQVMWDNCKELEKQLAYFKKIAEDNFILSVEDNETIDTWKQKYKRELKSSKFWRDAYDDVIKLQGKGYVFSEIPNDTDGQEFVDTMKKYFNKKSYKMRVRGQHIKPELKGTGATYWGQSISESTHMRIYIEAKKGE